MFGLTKLFKKRSEYIVTVSERPLWPMSSFKSAGLNQPRAWNNRFGKQNFLTKQFSKLWSTSLRSFW